jgi:hypothetical protein
MPYNVECKLCNAVIGTSETPLPGYEPVPTPPVMENPPASYPPILDTRLNVICQACSAALYVEP